MRRTIKILVLAVLGIAIGFIAYEAAMFIRVSRLRSENPVTTSLIEARVSEAKARGEQPKRMQIWVPLDKFPKTSSAQSWQGKIQISQPTTASITKPFKKHGTGLTRRS